MMERAALLGLVCVLALGFSSANAYEFKLLNGMKVKGQLRSFEDGRFFVDTDIGHAVIDADKLDYIIVEEADPGPSCAPSVPLTPGIGLSRDLAGRESMELVAGGEGAVYAPRPEPLQCHSVAPAPLRGRSVAPAPLLGRSVAPAPLRG